MIKKFKVGKRSDSAVIEVSDQTYVVIYDAKRTVVFSDKSNTGEVNPLLVPGDYAVETDGTVGSIKSSRKSVQDVD